MAGFAVLCLFGLFTLLGTAGTAALWLTGRVPASAMLLGGLVGLALASAAFIWFFVHTLRRFRTLVIEPDGTWRLVNLIGRELLRLPPEAQRAVDLLRAVTWYFTGVAHRVPRTWIELELPDGRRFASLRTAETAQAPTIAALRRLVEITGR